MVFSGIVEDQGEVVGVRPMVEGKPDDGIIVDIRSKVACSDAYIGCSIAVEGVCLTATEINADVFTVGISPETLIKTNLKDLSKGSKVRDAPVLYRLWGPPVNVERALAADARNSGHVVQGHIDGTGVIEKMWRDGESIRVLPAYIVPKGFIAIDGVSLTVCEVNPKTCTFTIMLVPHTQAVITLPHKTVGDRVNLEVDCLAKYVAAARTGSPTCGMPLLVGTAFVSALVGGMVGGALVRALTRQ
ncbi:Riboflavin synthase alpha chain [Perkinsus olseni]|uniref:Riboflavin synthase n=1 Tax=Perkinsus olseni TaxID=32597 RepID=A0A7J6SQ09_PEROL|nr:Riboflavin synthase alpha chain [Perkinsus olseni]